jgi:histidinol-phosphatase
MTAITNQGNASRHERDLTIALELADVADPILLRYFQSASLGVERKADDSPVTAADREAERAIRDHLAKVHPGDGIVGEEYGGESTVTSTRRWIIDPLDGTRTFVEGFPEFGSLIALEEDGEMVVGVASAPALKKRWWATRGGGAYADGRRLRVSDVPTLSQAAFAHGLRLYWEQRQMTTQLDALCAACGDASLFRGFIGYMRVAEGVSDVFAEATPSVWDVAAPMVIVEEAGGRVTDFRGDRRADGGTALVSNGLVHDAALAYVRMP